MVSFEKCKRVRLEWHSCSKDEIVSQNVRPYIAMNESGRIATDVVKVRVRLHAPNIEFRVPRNA